MLPHRSTVSKYLFLAFVALVLFYAYYEARNMLYGPQITLSDASGAITVHEELIEISGAAKNVVEITLSGRPVFIDDTGKFTERLLLAPGLNRFSFNARDKFGHATEKTLEVVYEPPTLPEPSVEETDTIEEQPLP